MLGLLQRLIRRSPAVTMTAQSGAEMDPVAGLIPIQIEACATAPTDARLVIRKGAEVLFEKPLALSEQAMSFWVALHGQLLPDGPTALEIQVRVGDRVAAAQAMTVQARNASALGGAVADSLRRSGAPAVLDGVCDSGVYAYDDPSLVPWFDRPQDEAFGHIADLTARGAADHAEAEALRHFVVNGFLTLPDSVAPEHLARLNAALDDAIEKKIDGYAYGSSDRIHGLHEHYPAIRELWLHPKVMRMLDLVFGAPARPCQSLTYVFGSQQEHHQDTIHLTPFPAGYMCGVWTALEDVQEDSGELRVFPGSHRLPRTYTATVGLPKVTGDWSEFGKTVVPVWTDMLNAKGFASVPYRPKAGAVLIWHENLMHGGAPRADMAKSRRSIVGHYFAEGAVAYYDSSGLPGAMHLGPRA